jgi:uncharacterized cofD-like protein
VLRDEFGLLPTSGVRQALVALSSKPSLLRELFLYRFHQGNGIKGMTFGNLFLAALADIVGSQEKAIEHTAELLSVNGKILPISYDDVRLVATYENGLEVTGEHAIDEPEHDGKLRIVSLRTEPQATISQPAKEQIEQADFIILGPGDFYTNTIANFVVDGVTNSIKKSHAKVIFIGNLMTKYGETCDFTLSCYLDELKKYIPLEKITTILLNDNENFPQEVLKKYAEEYSIPVADDSNTYALSRSTKIVRKDLLLEEEVTPQKGDVLKRSIIRHDAEKLAEALSEVIGK